MQQLSLYETFSIITNQALADIVTFLPRIIAGLVVFIIGAALARAFRSLIKKMLDSLSLSSAVEKTPIEHFLRNADITQKFEEIVAGIMYWVVMLVVIHTTVTILGLSSLSLLLQSIIGFLPRVVSSIIILFFGVLFAGMVETVVKGAIKSLDGRSARLLGKIASYLVVVMSIMAAISELGIAQEFILVLFIGFVATLTVAGGLAVGLGSKDLVATVLDKWYKNVQKQVKEEK
ncbi:MAG: hypothetical protein WAU07_01945 [Microgenomates group bacterium]